MASVKTYCILLIFYLQGIQGQQTSGNHQNVGMSNNGMALQQQAMQRSNMPNLNQIQNAGQNYNFRTNLLQNNLPQSTNTQGAIQQPRNSQVNIQQQGGSMPVNMQVNRQPQHSEISFANSNLNIAPQMIQGAANLPQTSAAAPIQPLNNNVKHNGQIIPLQNAGTVSNIPLVQGTQITSTLPYAESLNNQASLMSFNGPQSNIPPQNQQVFLQNPIPPQNQLTDIQKQTLVRSLQSQQPVNLQSQLSFIPAQSQRRIGPIDSQQVFPTQGQQLPSFQPLLIPMGSQPAFIPVQGQPLVTYLQNQAFSPAHDEEDSILSYILSELQPSSPHYAIASAYAKPKKGKSSLKALIPLIINLIKERNGCNCRNCGCQNDVGNNNSEEPLIFGGYSNQRNYSEKTKEPSIEKNDDVEIIESTPNKDERNSNKNNIDSSEVSLEEDSEYVDDEET